MHTDTQLLVEEWNQKLKEFGLSETQIKRQDVQYTLPCKSNEEVVFDPEIFHQWMADLGAKFETEEGCPGYARVRQYRTNRDVPWWAVDDNFIRDFILWRYPTLRKQVGTQGKYGRSQICTARYRAASTVAIIYLVYRVGFFNADVGELLGITEQAVDKHLASIKADAEDFAKAKHVVVKDVRVHACRRTSVNANGTVKKCACKYYLTHEEADVLVKHGEADWMWVYPPGQAAQPFQSHGDLVLLRANNTPRVMTIERANLQRASEGNEMDVERTEIYGELMQQVWTDLIKPFVADPFEGRAVIYLPLDQRTGK